MSAFLLPADRIRDIAAAIKSLDHGVPEAMREVSVADLAAAMHMLNLKSMVALYGDKIEETGIAYESPEGDALPMTDVELCKALECFLYQSCESEACRESPVFIGLELVAGRLARGLVHKLPAYSAAAWG